MSKERHSHILTLPTENAVLYGVLSNEGGSEETSRVLTYYIPDIDKTLAVLWYDSQSWSNKWNVRLFHGEKQPDKYMYSEMYSTSCSHPRDLGSGLKAFGSISSTTENEITLAIHVRKVM